MLGFDALGRFALGQLPKIGLTNTVLLGGTGAYTVAVSDAYSSIKQTANTVGFASAGYSAMMRIALTSLPGSIVVAGNTAVVRIQFPTGPGSFGSISNAATFATQLPCIGVPYVVSGKTTSFGVSLRSAASSYLIAGNAADFTRDFVSWFPLPVATDDWISGSIKATTTWTNSTAPAAGWEAQVNQTKTWTPAIAPPDIWTTE